MGFTRADYDEEVEVWPENWPAWVLFSEMAGQWRFSSAGGAVALDYCALFARMDRMHLSDAEWEERFAEIRVLESAALAQIAKKD